MLYSSTLSFLFLTYLCQAGDQGFLNSYYGGFANAHVFEPSIPQEVLDSRPVPEMERLSTLYNADVGLYMLANKVLCGRSLARVVMVPLDYYSFFWLRIFSC